MGRGVWGLFLPTPSASFFLPSQTVRTPSPSFPESRSVGLCVGCLVLAIDSRGPLAPPGCSPRRLWAHPRSVQRVRLGSNQGLRACAQAGPLPAESLRSAPGTVLLEYACALAAPSPGLRLRSLVPHRSEVSFHSDPSVSAAVFALLHLNVLLGCPSAHSLL